jgi:hypothetical protein
MRSSFEARRECGTILRQREFNLLMYVHLVLLIHLEITVKMYRFPTLVLLEFLQYN